MAKLQSAHTLWMAAIHAGVKPIFNNMSHSPGLQGYYNGLIDG